MTYSEAFSLWVAEVYRNHGYEPDNWYGSEVAETLYNISTIPFSSIIGNRNSTRLPTHTAHGCCGMSTCGIRKVKECKPHILSEKHKNG